LESKKSVAILSHRKDADGICSAAIMKLVYPEADIFLSDYSDMAEVMARIAPPADLQISDLALNDNSFPGFLEQVKRFRSSGSSVHYTDHHALKDEFKIQLVDAGVDLYHSKEESAAVLIYQKLREQLGSSQQAKILASCGAITDLMDDGKAARKIISSFDRQFLLYEATVLAFTISMIRKENESPEERSNILIDTVNRLVRGQLPHELPGAVEYSQAFADNAAKMLERLKTEGKTMGPFAFVKTEESSTGNVAYALIGTFNVPVGMAYREDGTDSYEVSLRATDDFTGDLSRIVGKIAKQLNTSGGGHAKASGIRIKRDQLSRLTAMLQEELEATAGGRLVP
jgi:oligoribonuclease NrnB/cAMP/cGMP phosphodiesterase (DHH superfamily)